MTDKNSDPKKNEFVKMYDRIFKNCKNKDTHEARSIICEEFLKTVKEMQGTDLEPYLAEMGHCKDFNIAFTTWVNPYSDLLDWSV